MKTLLSLLLLYPVLSAAQIDTLRIIRTDSLKPIESDLLPAYHGRYGTSVRTQYIYNGLDVRNPKDLGQYILASGDANAIHEFNQFMASRHTGGWLITGGVITTLIGGVIMISNAPDSGGKFNKVQSCPPGYICSGTWTVTDTERKNAYNTGGVTLLSGFLLAGIGWALNRPGQHLRRAVQYYNRALKQRGISWQLTPYSTYSSSGLGLVGKF